MESAASIAGIISLTGTVLQGAVKLHVFCTEVKAARKTVTGAMESLDAFKDILCEVLDLANELHNSRRTLIDRLFKTIKSCHDDILSWHQRLHKIDIRFQSGIRALRSRIAIAMSQRLFKALREDIDMHREQIRFLLQIQVSRAMQKLQVGQANIVSALRESRPVMRNIDVFPYQIIHQHRLCTIGSSVSKRLPFSATQETPQTTTHNLADSRDSFTHANCSQHIRKSQKCFQDYLTHLLNIEVRATILHGKLQVGLVSVPDPHYEWATSTEKGQTIKQLQILRLLDLILRKVVPFHDGNRQLRSRFDKRSGLILEGILNTVYLRNIICTGFIQQGSIAYRCQINEYSFDVILNLLCCRFAAVPFWWLIEHIQTLTESVGRVVSAVRHTSRLKPYSPDSFKRVVRHSLWLFLTKYPPLFWTTASHPQPLDHMSLRLEPVVSTIVSEDTRSNSHYLYGHPESAGHSCCQRNCREPRLIELAIRVRRMYSDHPSAFRLVKQGH